MCADHNDTGGGAEHRTGDPGDGGRIVPICDLGDAEGALVRKRLDTLRAAGTHILHYTHTRIAYWPNGTEQKCCQCCEELPYVLSRVDNETKNFPDDGMMIDNSIANDAWLPYYTAISKRARRDNPTRTLVTNPNCAHDYVDERCSKYCTEYGHSAAACADCRSQRCSAMSAEWFDIADIHCLSEGTMRTGTEPDFELKLPFEPTDEQRSKFAMVTYGAKPNEWRGLIDRARAKGFSKFWVDGVTGNNVTSFLTLPVWYEEMVQYVASFNEEERRRAD